MYLNALYCCLLTQGDLEPPRPSCVTPHHITPTHSTAGCFSSPLKPQVTTQGTLDFSRGAVPSPQSHPCLPLGEPRLCDGWNPCLEPEPPQNCLGKSVRLHQDMGHTVALGLGTLQGLWCHVGSWGWGCFCLLALPGCGQELGERRGGLCSASPWISGQPFLPLACFLICVASNGCDPVVQ